ncbi:MAG: UPF0280 family protein [Methanobacterium sp.]|nr:UPF0280 family protein [Methanobacterium sp.]
MINKRILIEETNIMLQSDIEPSGVDSVIMQHRKALKNYIWKHKEFQISLEPLKVGEAPLIVKMMAEAAKIAEVGPMAAVAGTISELSLNFLLENGAQYVIVDNGGDVALKTNKDVIMGLYAGESSLSGKIGFKIKHQKTPMGICTSSATVGHSISFGKADSVTIFASHASIADALATSIANHATGNGNREIIENCLEKAEEFREYFRGLMVVVGEAAGTLGKIPKLVETEKKVVLSDIFDIY